MLTKYIVTLRLEVESTSIEAVSDCLPWAINRITNDEIMDPTVDSDDCVMIRSHEVTAVEVQS